MHHREQGWSSGLGRRLGALLVAAILFGIPSQAALAAPNVVPSERVVRWVNVRSAPDSSSESLAKLDPGEQLELVEAVPAWYRVRLPDGREGFVSRAWTRRLDEAAFSPAYYLHLIDVGTGLAVFVEGRGFSLLYDAGSNDDTDRGDRNRVVAYLKRVRPQLRRIDHVILSHPHKDHVELMPDVLRSYEVGNVWDSGRTNPICSYRSFLRVIQERNIPYHDAHGTLGEHTVPLEAKACYGRAEPAETIRIPHAEPIELKKVIPLGPRATISFLHATALPMSSVNENSLVAVLELGRSRVLLTGDAEAGGRQSPTILPTPSSVEGELLACCQPLLRADVLVAGHHGSKTSSRTAFLDRVGASVFLVSAGPKRYASVTLPDAEVISELTARGEVMRTDSGDVGCKTERAKIGPDNDNQPGGCENVLVEIDASGKIRSKLYKVAD